MNQDRILEIIYNKIDPWSMETPDKTKDQIFTEMVNEITSKNAFPVEKDGMIFYIMPETPQRARLHLLSDTKTPGNAIKSGKWLTAFLFKKVSSLQKLYGITPHEKFLRIVTKFGWHHEGTLIHSHYTKSGQMKDQYVFGITRFQHDQQGNNAYQQNLRRKL